MNLMDTGDLRDLISLDPSAGSTYAGKPIWTLTQIEENLNRTGYDWYKRNYGELSDGVLNFGFWKSYEELANSYYVNTDGSTALNEAYFAADFSPFSEAQKVVARDAIGLWDDLINISFKETKSYEADLAYGNTDTGGAQAYAYLPFGDQYDNYYEQFGFEETGRLGGDVWIDGFVASNFSPLKDSYYSVLTMIHETGHALGLSHPGDYDALDDDDGDGVPDPITYENDAAFAQDSLQYSVMSYFDAFETGAQHIDWSLMNFAYAATPLVHDIAAIQAIYGIDTTSRTGDTVYGFNSNADRAAYHFDLNTRPVVAIWDAGGNDTLDFSGWNTPSTIDLNEGAFSSGGGITQFLTLDQINVNRAALGFAPRTAATAAIYEGFKEQYGITSPLYKDNVSIAYGAIIENAVGGGGNDLIIGNQVDNVLTGKGGSDKFLLKTAGTSGSDRITDFGFSDVLVVTKKIADSNNDGIITWSKAMLNLDPSDGDQVQITGPSRSAGLRYLGANADGEYFYADARIRPASKSGHTVREGTVGNETLAGAGSSTAKIVLFYDTANAAGTGADKVINFGNRDILVTTTKLFDDNEDNVVTFGEDHILSLGSQGNTIEFAPSVSSLELDGSVARNGIDYFVYSLVGSAAGKTDLLF